MVSGVLTGALVALPVLMAARGDGTFRAPILVPHSFGAVVAVQAGDFDGDGYPELALARGDSKLVVLACTGAPDGRWRQTTLPSVGEGSYALRAADLDGDGDDDLVVADPSTTVYMLLSDGDGSFEDPEPLGPVPGPRSLAVGDWNRDGTLDLATVNHPSPTISVLLGEGGRSFRLAETITVGAFHHNHDIASLDYDGDGILDLLVAVDLTGVQPLRGLGDGRFDVRAEIRSLITEPLHLLGADVDGDGLDDVIAAGRGLYTACVGRSLGNGAFERTSIFEGTWAPPALADIDDDGNADIILARTEERRLDVHAGDDTGRFSEPTRYALALVDPTVIAAVDLDLDGHDELVVADSGYEGLLVALRAPAEPPLSLGLAIAGFESVSDVKLHDLDGNGSPELWVAQHGKALTVFHDDTIPRTSSREAERPLPLRVESSAPLTQIAVADFDRDGVPDVAGTTMDPFFIQSSLLVAFLDRSGRVVRESIVDRGLVPTAVLSARLDEDSLPDLAATFAGTDEISVALDQKGGTFSEARRVPTVLSPRGLLAADLDGDGRADLVAWSTTDVAVHFGLGKGDFAPSAALPVGTVKGIRDVEVIDADSDGYLEVFACDGLDGRVLTFRLGANRKFRLETILRPGPSRLESLAAGDLDGDGLTDLTVASPSERTILVLQNRGSGGLEVTQRYAVGIPQSHQLVDVDLDGVLDLVALYSDEIAIFSGNQESYAEPPFLRGDVNSDGQVNITDGLRLLGFLYLGADPLPCLDAGDFDDSGALNLTDAVLVLDHLFGGGRTLPPPYPACGPDPTTDTLGCWSFEACP